MAINFLIGRKMGMTRIFDELGSDFPVTILEAGPCSITQIKTAEKDGYSSVQLGFQDKSERHLKKTEKGHFEKAGVSAKHILKEIIMDNFDGIDLSDSVSVNVFETGDLVTVSGLSKGKGFAGHMKRHGFSGGRRSHGKNSVMRKAGSVGAGTDPSRIWPGTRMAGRMGNEKVSVKNLEIVRVENDKNLLFIKGAVPGGKQGIVSITKQ
jgi:large subunit ribosomal protein L3